MQPTVLPTSSPSAARVAVGAWVDPPGSSGTSAQRIAALEATLGHKFDVSVHYDGWALKFPSADELDDRVNGRTPEVSWSCASTDASIVSGAQDAIITQKAQQMLAYGAPILLRYKWEFNLPDTTNGRTNCADSTRDVNGYFDPSEFVAAWQHIHAIFAAVGATNVAFVWNPSAGGNPGSAYWPGDASVDWVAVDIYDFTGRGLAATLSGPYAAYAPMGTGTHPFLIAETGAAANQGTYVDGTTRTLLALQFPQVRALTYFDAQGPEGNWSLTPSGLSSFATFINQ